MSICKTPGCNAVLVNGQDTDFICPRCRKNQDASESRSEATWKGIPNDTPVFMGVDLAAPGERDYSATPPVSETTDYSGSGGDCGGGGASSSYSSDSSCGSGSDY